MKGKPFVFTVLLAGLGTMLFAQPAVNISPSTIPNGMYGSAYKNINLTVKGGTPPYSFSVSSGNLPAGMNLSPAGVLSGTPLEAGNYSFTVTAQGQNPAPGNGGPGNGGPGNGNGNGNGKGNGPGNGPGGGPGANPGSQTYTLTVEPATLTITANNAKMTYGGVVPALSASISGFVNGDKTSSLTSQPSISTTATSASSVGKYPITVSGAADPNYGFTYRSGTLTVDPASLTITANNESMQEGEPLPALTASYAGFVNGDDAGSLNTPPVITTNANSSSPDGNYVITVAGAKDPNYAIAYVQGTLAIKSASIHVDANAQTKEYGTPDPTLTYTVSGLPAGVNSSIFTGSLTRAPGENAGTYPITIGNLTAGRSYNISFTGNDLTITKASQQITWSQNLAVGCSGNTQIPLNATANSGLPVTYSISDNSVATVSGNLLTLLKPGTAVVTAIQTGDQNYEAASAMTDTVTYQPASLITQHWDDVLIFDNSSGNYVAWQWYKDGAAVAGDTTPYYSDTASLNGQYYVIATNKEGQHIQSCTLTVTAGAAAPGGIRVYPNPANKGVVATVVSNYDAATLQGAVLQIADIRGRVLQQLTPVQPTTQITLPAATGIYIVDLLLTDGQRVSTNVLVGQ